MDLEQLLTAGGTGGLVGLVLLVLLRSMAADRKHYREQLDAADKRADDAEARTLQVRATKEALHERLDTERDKHRAEVDQLHEQLRQAAGELADARRLLARCCTQRDRDGPP